MTPRIKTLVDIFVSAGFTTFMFVSLVKLITTHQLREHWVLGVFYFVATIIGCLWFGKVFSRKS